MSMGEPSSSSTAMPTSSTSSPSSSQQQQQRLQGPRPAPLRVRRGGDSSSSQPHHAEKKKKKMRRTHPQQVRQPVIIYTVSPRVVHAEPSEFMSVVQRLTGAAASHLPPPEPTTMPFPFRPHSSSMQQFPFQLHQVAEAVDDASASGRQLLPPLPSILSPVPGSLPAVPPSFFSPPAAGAAAGINLFGELISPPAFHLGATTTAPGASQILPSPSGGAYYWDLFNNHHHNL